MFKRRRSVAASGASGLPFCAMCGQGTRVDASTGRCALGHRVAVAPVTAIAAAPVAVGNVTPLVAAAASSDYDHAADTYMDRYPDTIAWEPSAPLGHSEPASDVDALDEFIAWEQPGGGTFSALDVDTAELPLADQSVAATPADEVHDLGSSLLDELDDAAHARRQAVGTIGATIAFSGMVFVAVAALPF